MSGKGSEVLDELKSVLSGKTVDALFPPLIFVIANGLFGLMAASVIAMVSAAGFTALRMLRRQELKYALGGLVSVVIAVGFAYLSGSAENFFIPKIISSAFMVLLSLGSILAGKPLAALMSHLTRGWPMEWFRRKDVKPAYAEVTAIWTLLLAMRLIIQVLLYRGRNVSQIFWVNTLIGTPFTIIVLIFSYLYGIWKLGRLKGPGVDEFIEGKPEPWKGQRKGF